MAGEIFSTPTPRYFSVPSGRPFLDDMALGLTTAIAVSGFELPDATIYLPTRRAARALGDAFLRARQTLSGTGATLVPHIKTLGDIDDDEFTVAEASFDARAEDELALDPAASTAQRRLMLARLIAEREKSYFDGQRHWAGAIAAADELGKLLDSLHTEEVDVSALQTIVPENLAEHWRQSLDFLTIVTQSWPEYLSAQGLLDPAARRIALIHRQTARWAEVPPQKPVIIAGTTGSTPAVAKMMRVVAGLPNGCVVLPGLDLASPPHVWKAIDDPHPQSGLKALLGALEAVRSDVRPWPVGAGVEHPRAALTAMALRPADASDDWRQWAEDAKAAKPAIDDALDGLSLAEARDEEREASIIALKMRETIETPGRTAMLVTLDRDLARRVAIKMRRWGVNVDDSAGAPFANTPCGIFLRLTAAWLGDVADPVRLTAMLDHARFGGGLDDEDRARSAGRIDRALRGLPPGDGIDGLRRRFSDAKILDDHIERLLDTLTRAAALWGDGDAPFADRFEAHLEASEVLAASADDDGAQRLWRGDDGEAGAAMLAQLRDGLGLIVHDRLEEYTDIFTRLIAGGAVRRRAPPHPRLSILGPLEARLQSADVMILGGLNEGVWPRDAGFDPFLSRPMREAIRLPSPERRVGLAAHDFAQLAAAPEVMMTRTTRAAGKPTKPSRWIIRLRNILKGAGVLETVDVSAASDRLATMLDQPAAVMRISAPCPRPPVAARPTRFSVTRIEKLLRDPYAIYANKVLRLKKLDALGETFGARHLGNLLHAMLEAYAHEPPAAGDARIARLEALFDQHKGAHGFAAHHGAFWRARLRDAFVWLAEWDTARRERGAPVVVEQSGEWAFDIDGVAHVLTAKADRIDQLNAGGAFVLDYKTGAPPSLRQAQKFSPQLPLTGVILGEGGFAGLAGPVDGFEYVRVIGRGPKDRRVFAQGDDAHAMIGDAKDGVLALLARFQEAEQAYPSQPRPQYTDDFGDFDHLARRRERNAQGESDGGGDQS